MTNKQLFKEIYSNHVDEIFRFCMFKTNNREEAEDITSESFIRLFSQDISEIQNPRAWLYRVARNLIYDKYVRQAPDNLVVFTEQIDEERIENAINKMELKAINESTIEIIKTEIANLDSLTADIITFRIWEEMSFREIAEATDLTEANAKMRFYRGINQLETNINKTGKSIPAKAIIGGILSLSLSPALALNAPASAAIAAGIGSSLGLSFTLSSMVGSSFGAAGAAGGAGIFATTTAKVIAVAAIAVAGTGIGLGVISQSPSPEPENTTKTEVIQNTTNDSKYLTFNSPRYNVSFGYDKNYGEAIVEYDSSTKIETVSFPDSNIILKYPSLGFVPVELEDEGIYEGNEITFDIKRGDDLRAGTYKDAYYFSNTENESITVYAREIPNAEYDSKKVEIEKIIDTLVFEPGERDMILFQSSRYDVSFEYPKEFGDIAINYQREYFNSEFVSFSNSPITLQYPRLEGAGGGAKTYKVTLTNGESIDFWETPQGTNQEFIGLWGSSKSIDGKFMTIQAQNIQPNNVDNIKDDIEEIAKTLSFNLGTTKAYQLYFSKAPENINDFGYVESIPIITDRTDVATFLVEELIKGPTDFEKNQGFQPISVGLTGESNCGGKDFSLNIEHIYAIFRFCKDTTNLNDMRNPDFTVALEKTLTQFDTINSVIILDKNGNCWNDMTGISLSCQYEEGYQLQTFTNNKYPNIELNYNSEYWTVTSESNVAWNDTNSYDSGIESFYFTNANGSYFRIISYVNYPMTVGGGHYYCNDSVVYLNTHPDDPSFRSQTPDLGSDYTYSDNGGTRSTIGTEPTIGDGEMCAIISGNPDFITQTTYRGASGIAFLWMGIEVGANEDNLFKLLEESDKLFFSLYNSFERL